MKFLHWLYTLCRWVLGTVFIYAGGTKLMEPEVFGLLIQAYGIVPDGLILPIAVFLPVCEVIAGIGIVFDIKGSLGILSGLVLFFLIILGYGIYMGLDVDCGCFGPADPEARAFHGLRQAFYRDLFLAGAIAFVYAWRRVEKIRPRSPATCLNHFKPYKKEIFS